jgi:hypothetical protein
VKIFALQFVEEGLMFIRILSECREDREKNIFQTGKRFLKNLVY